MALRNKHLTFFGLSLGVLIIDILTKAFALRLEFGQTIPVINNILHITLVRNYGVSFGLLNNMNLKWLWVLVVIIAIAVIFYHYKDITNWLTATASSLILAGAVGNGIDRVVHGFVVDFIDFRIWPAFNVADSAITIGALLLIIYWWKER